MERLKLKIPSVFQCIPFKDITLGDYCLKCILGKLWRRYSLQKTPKGGQLLKVLLEENETELKLQVFLFDEFALKVNILAEGDFIAFTGYYTEEMTLCPNAECFIPLQVLLQPTENCLGRSKLWISLQNSVLDDFNYAPAFYSYSKLNELVPSAEILYNIYGVVANSAILNANSTIKLVIVDQTVSEFLIYVFCKNISRLPIIAVGDIVRIHRVHVYHREGNTFGICYSIRYVLVFGYNDDSGNPRTVSSTFTFHKRDIITVETLREWQVGYDTEQKKLSCLEMEKYSDILCQLIAIYVIKFETQVVLQVWDGSNIRYKTRIEIDDTKRLKYDETLSKKAKNYIASVMVYDCHAVDALNLLPGQWLELCNVHLYKKKNSSQAQLTLHSGRTYNRGIRVLDPSDKRIEMIMIRMELS